MSMSRTTGKFKVVENGEVLADKHADEIVKVMEQVPVQVIGQLCMIIHAYLWACHDTGWDLHPGLLLQEPPGGGVHVHVRVGDRRPGVQQGAQ